MDGNLWKATALGVAAAGDTRPAADPGSNYYTLDSWSVKSSAQRLTWQKKTGRR